MSLSSNRNLIAAERVFKNGVINFGRNVWLGIAAIAMIAITLTILLFAVVANATFNHSIDVFTDRIDIKFYFQDDVPQTKKDQFIEQVKRVDNVKSVTYISKEQALKDYREQNAGDKELLSAISLTDNPLPSSITIKPEDPNKINDIRTFLSRPEVEDIRSTDTDYSEKRKEAIDNIINATRFFEQAGIIGIIVFTVISMLIIFNTIRMAIFNRRDELMIMRLLGASPWYIKGPFVVETMLYGVIAAVLSVIVCGSLFKLASSTLQASSFGLLDISYSSSYFSDRLPLILTLQIAIGIIIGAASSTFATRRYLRLK